MTISENDVDWIADVISHMGQTGHAAVEASLAAEDAWMAQIHALASRSLMLKAKTWWVGSNVKGKPQGMLMFTGGFHKYREACEAVAANGYRDLVFNTGSAAARHPQAAAQ